MPGVLFESLLFLYIFLCVTPGEIEGGIEKIGSPSSWFGEPGILGVQHQQINLKNYGDYCEFQKANSFLDYQHYIQRSHLCRKRRKKGLINIIFCILLCSRFRLIKKFFLLLFCHEVLDWVRD